MQLFLVTIPDTFFGGRDLRSPARSGVSPRPFAARCDAVLPSSPVIGHLKEDHRLGRNYLKARDGDRSNAVLAAAGYNFSLLLRWFRRLLRSLLLILARAVVAPASLKTTLGNILHGRRLRDVKPDCRDRLHGSLL
jgi:hypothetical protein